MARKSKIDQMPQQIRDLIESLRGNGRTIDQIHDKLAELLPSDQVPARSSVGLHVQKLDALAEKIRIADRMAENFLGPDDGNDRLTRASAKALGSVLFGLVTAEADEDGAQFSPTDVRVLSQALRNIAGAKKTAVEYDLREQQLRQKVAEELREEMRKKLDAAVGAGGFDAAAAEEARRIMGFTS